MSISSKTRRNSVKGHTEKEFWFGLDKEELKDFETFLREQPTTTLNPEQKPIKPLPQYLKHRFLGVIDDLREE